ncbi:MAG: hypothetical protein IPK79_10440 [Vampirovibrionales bacterium]|nr:hypothetical protein [Vampirovibrionales bacterium]
MGGFLKFLTPMRERFFTGRDPAGTVAELQPFLSDRRLQPEEQRALTDLATLALREQSRYDDAMRLYTGVNDWFQAGYCEMLKGNLAGARHYWMKLEALRQNHWAVTLFGLVTRQLASCPTPFQIRNHLECDVTNLIQAGQFEFLENLLSHADFLVQVNPETYKFLGRSLMHMGWGDRAEAFLFEGQRMLPNDPEIYYHLGQYCFQRKRYDDCRVVLSQCLLISAAYNPARELLEKIPASGSV